MINVQFDTERQGAVVTYFGSPQDGKYHQHIGTVLADDLRWKAFYERLPESSRIGMPPPKE
jgi:hypothetical protein